MKETSALSSITCTANDVALTDIVPGSVVIVDDGCTSTSDTVTFYALGVYELTTQERYDIGTFIATDGDPNGDGAKTGTCVRFAFPINPAPSIDSPADACGDIDEGSSPLSGVPIGTAASPITIPCTDNDEDGKVDLIHCETWNQPGADETCTGDADVKAGSPAKCNCATLPSFCIVIDDGNPCTIDECDASGNVVHRPAPAGTACGDPASGPCDLPDTCNASGVCQPNTSPSTTICRASAGTCDVAESCDGVSRACPADVFTASTTICRASAGDCDVAESCTGSSAACPADNFAAPTTVCRTSAGVCDVAESCTGSAAACPADGFAAPTTVCRTSAGVCDVAESCTGSGAACPADGFASPTTTCRAAAGDCDQAESCTGSGAACPADDFKTSTTTCRAAAGDCDQAESCTGSSATCPADDFKTSTTTCRAAAGDCDVAESCTGSGAACPADGFANATTTCRAAAGDCDVAESCTGSSAECPTDGFASPTTPCRAATGDCDLAESCAGDSADCPADDLKTATTVCRPAVDGCDQAESCTGTSSTCPADTGSSCEFVCRTPGYWGTHENQTQYLLTAAGGISVCGVTVQAYTDCAVEGLCNTPNGNQQLILARHLLAAELNCLVTTGDETCSTIPAIGNLISSCTTICTQAGAGMGACSAQLDCLNNGGQWIAGACALGTCSVTTTSYCSGHYPPCPTGETCVPFPGNCHDSPFSAGAVPPPGGSASPAECSAATKSPNTMFTAGVCPI